MKKPDGIETALPPDPTGLGLGGLGIAGSIAAMVLVHPCVGLTLLPVFVLLLLNGVRGAERTRVLSNKLLIERSRPVREFLIGPKKERIPWDDFAGATIAGDHVAVTTKSGNTVQVGKGCPTEELEDLVGRIERMSTQEPIL